MTTPHPSLPSRRDFLGRAAATTIAMGGIAAASTRSSFATPREGFAPPLGVCTGAGNVPLLRSAGLDYVEVGVRRFLKPDRPEAEFAENRKLATKLDIPVRAGNGFLPGSLKCTGPAADHDAVLAYSKIAFARAEQVGLEYVVFGSSGARTPPDGFDHHQAELQLVALLAKMAPLAEKHGVTICLEPLNRGETDFVNTVKQGTRLASAVQHPRVRLVADIFHMLREDEGPKAIRDAGELIAHMHIAEKAKRTSPGVDGDDFTPYFRALAEIGFDGGISIECGWKDMARQLPVAVETLRDQLARV